MKENRLMKALFGYEGKTPEETFDRLLLSTGYKILLGATLFLVVGVEAFIGIMSRGGVIAAAGIIGSLAAVLILAPLLWESTINSGTVRKVRRAAYFPIRIRQFVLSKWKLAAIYGGVLWLISFLVQLVFAPLFGLKNLLFYQGALVVVFVANVLMYTVIGTVGAKSGE